MSNPPSCWRKKRVGSTWLVFVDGLLGCFCLLKRRKKKLRLMVLCMKQQDLNRACPLTTVTASETLERQTSKMEWEPWNWGDWVIRFVDD